MQQFNTQNGQSWIDVCLNTYGTLDYLGKLLNDNNLAIDSFPQSNQSIIWDNELVKDSSIKSLIDANKYVFASSIEDPIKDLSITSYSAGVSQIDVTNNGGDDWSFDFFVAPISLQVPIGVTVDSIDYFVAFWSGGTDSSLDNGNSITDYTFTTNSNGAGVYDLDCVYNMSDGSSFQITKLVLVDGSGTILASVEAGGVTVNSVSGLVIDISADITQIGVTYPISWGAAISGGFVLLPQTGANVVLTLPIGTTNLFTVLTLDSTFTNDYTANEGLVRTSITIS